MVHFLGVFALAAYVISAVIFAYDFYRDYETAKPNGERALTVGFVAHSLLIVTTLSSSNFEFSHGRADYYLFLAWAIPLAYGVIRCKLRQPIVGVFLAAATIIFLASSSYLLHLSNGRSTELSWFFKGLHVLPALVAELCLVVAVVLSILYRLQNRRFKNKLSVSSALRGPSLDLLNRWNLSLLSIGFIAMSFSVVSGSIWALFHQRSVFTRDPFQWMGFLVWTLLGAVHLVRSLRGRSAGILSKMTIFAGIIFLATLCLFLFAGEDVNHAVIYLS